MGLRTALGSLGTVAERRAPRPLTLGVFGVGPKMYGVEPASYAPRVGYGVTPALAGLFRNGRRHVGISQINTMATNITRGGGG